MALALGRGERGYRSGLMSAVFADIALLLAALIERVAALAGAIGVALAERRRQTVHRRRLMPTVLAAVVLHRSRKRNQRSKTHRRNNYCSHRLFHARIPFYSFA